MQSNYSYMYNSDGPDDGMILDSSLKRLTFLSIILAVLKRPWILLLAVVVIMSPLIYYIVSMVPVYNSSTTVMVSIKGGSLLSEISLGNQNRANTRTMMYYTSILDSRVFDKAVHDYALLYDKSISADSMKSLLAKSEINYQTNPREEGFIKIFARSENVHLSHFLAQTALMVFRERSIELERQEAQDIAKFIEDQLAQLNSKMEKAENDVHKYLEEKKLVYEDMEMGISKQLFEFERALTEAEANHEMVQINITSYQEKISNILQQLAQKSPAVDDTKISRLRGRLNELNLQLSDSASKNLSAAEVQTIYTEINTLRNELVNSVTQSSTGDFFEDENSRITLQKLEIELEASFLEREKYRNQERFHEIQLKRFRQEHPNISRDILDFASLVRAKEVLAKTIDILLEKGEEARIRVASEHGGIKVIDEPLLPGRPLSTRKVQKLLMGLFGSLAIGIIITVLIDMFDTTIKEERDINPHLQLTVFGTLPVMQSSSKSSGFKFTKKSHAKKTDDDIKDKLLTEYPEKSPIAEAYRSMKTSIQFVAQDKSKKIFVISSANPSEGKSLVSANLGISFAQGGQKTLILDGDLRRPVQHNHFGFNRKPGLTNHLYDEVSFEEIVHQTSTENLSVILAGTSPTNPAEILHSRKMIKFLEKVRENFDIILIDSPPIIACVDSRILGQASDGMMIVAKVESTKSNDIEHVVRLSRQLNVEILGVVLNQVEFHYGYPYYYAYRYYNPYSYYYGNYNYYYYAQSDDTGKVSRKRRDRTVSSDEDI